MNLYASGIIFILGSLLSALIPSRALASPAQLTYQGRILKTDGTPLIHNSVSFIFQIKGGPNEQCLIYQEQVNGVDLSSAGGVFDVPIGTGTVSYPTTGLFTVLDAFNNSVPAFDCGTCSISGATVTCSPSGSQFTPAGDDIRTLKVQFYDGTGWKAISPSSIIRSVPFAGYSLSAQKLGANVASDFILKKDVNNPGAGSISCDSGNFLTWDATAKKFGCAGVSGASGGTVKTVAASVGSNPYLTVSADTTNPVVTLNVGTVAGTVAAGNDSRLVNAMQTGAAAGGDLAGTYPNPSVAKIQNTLVSATTPSGAGQVLRYNGATQYVPTFLNLSDIRSSVTPASTAFPVASCTSKQTLTWVSLNDTLICTAIAIDDSQIAFTTSRAANTFLAAPSGGAGAASFRTLTAADLPTGGATGVYANGGNSFGAAATLGTNDNNSLTFKTNNTNQVTIAADGKVGIGTTNPVVPLTVQNSLTASSISPSYSPTQVLINDTPSQTTGIQISDFVINMPSPAANSVATNIASFSQVYVPASSALDYKNLYANSSWSRFAGSGNAVASVGIQGSAGNSGVGTLVNAWGLYGMALNSGSGNLTNAMGTNSQVQNTSGTIDTAYGVYSNINNIATITTAYGLYLAKTNSGTITNNYGVYQSDSANNYFAGNVGIGVTAPTAALHLKASTGALNTAPLKLTSGINLATPEAGAVEYDGTNLYFTDSTAARRTIATTSGGTYTGVSSITNSGGNITLAPNAATGSVLITSNTPSTGAANGALVVSGGAGFAGNIYSAASINAATTMSALTSILTPQLYGSASASGDIKVDGTSHATKGNVLLASAGGKVGIGVSTVGATTGILEVAGTSSSGSFMYVNPVMTNAATGSSSLNAYNSFVPSSAPAGNISSNAVSATVSTGSANANANTNLNGISTGAYYWNAAGTIGTLVGTLTTATNQGGGTVNIARGTSASVSNLGAGTISSAFAVDASIQNTGIGTITNAYAVRASGINNSGGGSIGTSYGLYIGKQNASGVGASYGVYQADSGDKNYFAGNVGIGTIPTSPLTIFKSPTATSGAVEGVTVTLNNSPATDSSGAVKAGHFTVSHSGPGNNTGTVESVVAEAMMGTANTVSTMTGVKSYVISTNAGGTVSNAYGVNAQMSNAGTMTTARGLNSVLTNTGTANIGTSYELYLDTLNSGTITNQYAVYQNSANSKNYFAGTVGIGTTAPVGLLSNSTTNTGDIGTYAVPNGTGIHAKAINWEVNGVGYGIQLANSGTAPASNGLNIYTVASDSASFILMARSNGTSKFLVRADGNVGIGTAAPAFTLDVNGSIAAVGALQAHSDRRLKKNIVNVDSPLEKLQAINGVYFDWRKDEFPKIKFEGGRQLGVIAQEVERVFPEAVAVNKDGIRSVAYTMLIAPLIEAVKELYSKALEHDKQLRQIASAQDQKADRTETDALKFENAAKDKKILQLEQENAAIKAYLCSKDKHAAICK